MEESRPVKSKNVGSSPTLRVFASNRFDILKDVKKLGISESVRKREKKLLSA